MMGQADCSKISQLSPLYYVCMAQNGTPVDCKTIPSSDPRYEPCWGAVALVTGAQAINQPIDLNPADWIINALKGLGDLLFKALGLGGLKDGMWRLLLILAGIMVVGIG